MRSWILLILLVCAGAYTASAVDWNSYRPIGHVNDFSNVLSENERTRLELLLQEVETKYSVNLVLFTLPNLEAYNIEEVTKYIYDTWDMGRGTSNKAALLLLSTGDGRMHLYVGMGLRAVFTKKWTIAMGDSVSGWVESRQYNKAVITAMTDLVARIYNRAPDLAYRPVIRRGQGAFQNLTSGSSAFPIAALAALALGGVLVISTVMRAGRQSSVYEWGRDFERNRTGPFGNKKPRML